MSGDINTFLDLELLAPELTFADVRPSWLSGPTDFRESIWSRDWDPITNPGEVREAAKVLLRGANERLAADNPMTPSLEMGSTVWEVDNTTEPAQIKRSAFVEVHSAVLTVSSTSPTVSINGFHSAPPRTTGQRAREFAQMNPHFAAAMSLFADGGDDIRKLWLPFEYVKKHSGYKPEQLVSASSIAAFSATANEAPNVRHIGGQRGQAFTPIAPADARRLVGRLLMAWLAKERPY